MYMMLTLLFLHLFASMLKVVVEAYASDNEEGSCTPIKYLQASALNLKGSFSAYPNCGSILCLLKVAFWLGGRVAYWAYSKWNSGCSGYQ